MAVRLRYATRGGKLRPASGSDLFNSRGPDGVQRNPGYAG